MNLPTKSPGVNGVSPDSRLFSAIARCMLKWEIRSKQAWAAYMDNGGVRSSLPIAEWRRPLTIWSRAHDRQRHLIAACMGCEAEGTSSSTVIQLGTRMPEKPGRRAA